MHPCIPPPLTPACDDCEALAIELCAIGLPVWDWFADEEPILFESDCEGDEAHRCLRCAILFHDPTAGN